MAAKYPVTHSEAQQYVKDLNNTDIGGFTHRNLTTGVDPTGSNLMVSIKGAEHNVPLATMTPDDILDYQQARMSDLLHPDQFLGGWANTPEGLAPQASLDVSKGVPFKGAGRDKMPYSEAMRQAALNEQKAIYDPRPRAANPFPTNPHYGQPLPERAKSRSAWDYDWLTKNATGSLEGGQWYPEEDD